MITEYGSLKNIDVEVRLRHIVRLICLVDYDCETVLQTVYKQQSM